MKPKPKPKFPKPKLSPELLAYFREQGSAGGKVGGKIAAAKMTAKERSERARKAAEARWASKKQ